MTTTGVNIKARDIINSNVAGESITITNSGEQPQREDFQRMLAQVLATIMQLAAQQDALTKISPAAPFQLSGAQAALQALSADFEGEEGSPQAAKVKKCLTEAKLLLQNVQNNANEAAGESEAQRQAARSVLDALPQVVEQTNTLEQWASELWETK